MILELPYMQQIGPEQEKLLLANINGFKKYAVEPIERNEVSIDVLAKNSSYRLWAKDWKALKSKLL